MRHSSETWAGDPAPRKAEPSRIVVVAVEVADVQTEGAAGARTVAEEAELGAEAAAGLRRCTWRVEACLGCMEAARDCRPWAEPPEPVAVGTTAGAGAVDSCAEVAAAGRTAAVGEASTEVACLSRQRSRPPQQRPRQPSCGCRPEFGR